VAPAVELAVVADLRARLDHVVGADDRPPQLDTHLGSRMMET